MIEFQSVGSIFHLLEPYIHVNDIDEPYLRDEHRYGLYFDVAAQTHPNMILEIGVRYGYSAIAMMLGCNGNASYFGFDAQRYEPGSNRYAQEKIKEVCGRWAEVNEVDTQVESSLPGMDGVKCDLIHVDADHSIKGLKHDLDLVSRYAAPHAHIIVDDTNHPGHPGLGLVTKAWANVHGYEVQEFKEEAGRMVLRKP